MKPYSRQAVSRHSSLPVPRHDPETTPQIKVATGRETLSIASRSFERPLSEYLALTYRSGLPPEWLQWIAGGANDQLKATPRLARRRRKCSFTPTPKR